MSDGTEKTELSKDQLAVMVRLSQSKSQQQIADDMGKSLSWVQKTVRSVKDHYGVDSLPALITTFTEEAPDARFFDPDKEERVEPYNLRVFARKGIRATLAALVVIVTLSLALRGDPGPPSGIPLIDISIGAVIAGAIVNLLLGYYWFGLLHYSRLVELHMFPSVTLDKNGTRRMFFLLIPLSFLGSWLTGVAALHFELFGPNPTWWMQILTGTIVAGAFTTAPLVTTVFSTRIEKRGLWISSTFWGIARPMACAAVHVLWPETWF